MGPGADEPVVRVTLWLDAIDPPAGTLGLEHDGERMAFAGWVSLIGAIKTVTAGSLGRTGHDDDDTRCLGGPE